VPQLVSSHFNAGKVVNEKADVRIRFVMQDHKDPRAFTIVERYEHESSQK
jgi:hypothetical protein